MPARARELGGCRSDLRPRHGVYAKDHAAEQAFCQMAARPARRRYLWYAAATFRNAAAVSSASRSVQHSWISRSRRDCAIRSTVGKW